MKCNTPTNDVDPSPKDSMYCCKANCIGLITVGSLITIYVLVKWIFNVWK